METVVKASLLEHPQREPCQHFPAGAAADNSVDFPQLTLPEETAVGIVICFFRSGVKPLVTSLREAGLPTHFALEV